MTEDAINPFQTTKPVGPDEVIDRDVEARALYRLAEEGNNARLVAPRRYGKTSLLARVQSELEATGLWIPVYVDLLGVTSLDVFSDRIERAYEASLKGKVAIWFASARRSLRPTISAGGGVYPMGGSVDLSGAAKAGLSSMLDLPKKVCEKSGNRVHVVFDEFQEILKIDDQIDSTVRSVIQHHGDAASYVFAGSEIDMMEQLFTDSHRAFFAQAEPVRLRRLENEPLGIYIADRFTENGRTITPAALGELLRVADGHPQRAMAAAHALWDASPRGAADLEEWSVAYVTLMSNVDDEMKALWASCTNVESQVLTGITVGGGPYSRELGTSRGKAVGNALSKLSGRGVIVKDGKRWRLIDPLLRAWIVTLNSP